MSVTSSCEVLTPAEELTSTINDRRGHEFPEEWIDVVYSVARRSDTWTARH
jgi:hypothetical protein